MSEEDKVRLTSAQKKEILDMFKRLVESQGMDEEEPSDLVDYLFDIIVKKSEKGVDIGKILSLTSELPEFSVINLFQRNNKTILYSAYKTLGRYFIKVRNQWVQDTILL